MIRIIALLLSGIFLSLAAVHIYWSAGGQTGINAALPVGKDHKKVFSPRPGIVFITGAAFACLGFVVLMRASVLPGQLPLLLKKYGLWGIAVVFIARATGDFYYVGFFKKIQHTRFGRYDTCYYSPLSLLVGLLAIGLELCLRA